MTIGESSWEKELCAAIVRQAYEDYKTCVRIYKCYPPHNERYKRAVLIKEEIIRFIRSDWYEQLTDIPRENLLRRLREVEDSG